MIRNRIIFHLILDEIEEEEVQPYRLSLFQYNRYNYDLRAPVFRQTFRVDRFIVVQIENHIGRFIQFSRRNNALSPRQQILTVLTFLGNGAQYHTNGNVHGISKSTVFRCLHRVCSLIVTHLMPIFVRWPSCSRSDERLFARRANFPNVKGIVDGTLIHMDAPYQDEPVYVGRDNKHSLNVLLVSGPVNQFYFASAFPGSFHDARCIRMSALWNVWDMQGWRPDNDPTSIILADSAYPLRDWLIPPTIRNINANIPYLANAVPSFERAHRSTRFIVECSIGILKEIFPTLNYLRIREPRNIAKLVYACITLHNMQNKYRHGNYSYDVVLSRLVNQQPLDENNPVQMNIIDGENLLDGVNRQREILEYFARLNN